MHYTIFVETIRLQVASPITLRALSAQESRRAGLSLTAHLSSTRQDYLVDPRRCRGHQPERTEGRTQWVRSVVSEA